MVTSSNINQSARIRLLWTLALVLLMATAARASAQSTQPAHDDAEAARAAFAKLVERYASLETYQDRLEMKFEMKLLDSEGDNVGQQHEMSSALKFANPQRVACEGEPICLYSDGKNIWRASEQLGQYIETDAGDGFDFDDPMLAGNPLGFHPVLSILLHPQSEPSEIFPELDELTRVTQETRDGRQYQVIHGNIRMKMTPSNEPMEIQAWIDPGTGLLAEMSVDMTEAMKDMAPMMAGLYDDDEDKEPTLEKASLQIHFTEIKIDEPIPDKAFVFENADDYTKVKKFNWMGQSRNTQDTLLARPAPDFSGKTIDEQSFKLSDLRGKVVVLDFWATWCGPCVMAIPHIQKLHEEFKDQPVAVVGINRDSKGPLKAVKKLLKKEGITFTQFMDPDGNVAKKYKVTGIPCTVLIDKAGVLADIHTGFMPGMEKELSKNITKLLKGEAVLSADELASRKEDAAADDQWEEAEPKKTTSIELGDQSAEKLREGEHDRVEGVSVYQARRADIDGDGQLELILPTWQGKTYLLSADGGSVERIHMKGLSEGVESIEAVNINGKRHWLVALYSAWGDDQPAVILFDPAGEPLWRFEPKRPDGYGAEVMIGAGDLDGDGITECVVGLTLFKTENMEGNMWSHTDQEAYLLVLSRDGECLSQKEMPGHLALLHVAAPDAAGRRAVLWFGHPNMRRFYWQPNEQPPSATPLEQ